MRSPLSIVHFIREIRAEEGGVVKAVVDLSQAMAARGHRVLVATADASDVPAHWRDASSGVPKVLEFNTLLHGGRLAPQDLHRFEEAVAGFHVGHLHTPWEMANTQLAKVLKFRAIPYIVSVHGMLDDYCMQQKTLKKRIFLKLLGRKLFQSAAVIHYTAEGERLQAQKWVPKSVPYFVQALAVDVTSYLNLPGPEEARQTFAIQESSAPKVLYLSRLHPKKGLELLLQATAQRIRAGKVHELLIAGPGEESYTNKLKALCEELGIQRYTKFLGMVKGRLKVSLYQAADVFVLPTHQENFGLVLVEALACGTPVVTTRGTDIWPELQSAGAQIVDSSPAGIAAAIAEVVSRPAANCELGQKGRQYVLDWLAPDQVALGYERMYSQACGQPLNCQVCTGPEPPSS